MASSTEPQEDIAAAASAGAPSDLMASSIADYTRIWGRRVRSGESGALPVIVGLIAIVAFFWVRIPSFMTPRNMVNLMTQSSFIITLGMAEIFVLLLGDIDLAAGYTAACGAVIALWMLALGDPWWVAVLVALAACGAYGALQGIVTAKLGLPSFVVTLAGQLGLSGLLLYLIDQTGSIGTGGVIALHNTIVNDIENGQLNATWTWIVMVAIAVGASVAMFLGDLRRRSNGLVAPPLSITTLKVAATVAACLIVALVANINRGRFFTVIQGMPWAVLVVLAILAIWTVLLGRTKFGRYVYAIGGSAEAARRAGINVTRIRTIAFALCGITAGMTGIIYASYLGSISSNVNGGQNVLYAVAAAVIGGTSLFGGRGKMLHAVLGGLVVGVIYNGLELLGLSASAQLMWTALVLLAAVIVDRLTRRGQVARLPVGAGPGPCAARDTGTVGDKGLAGRRAVRQAVHQAVGGGLAELVPDLSRPGSWLLFLDGVPQSQVDLGDPEVLEFEYVRRIGHVIDLALPPGQPARALHLGGGALTLPRYVAHTRPGSSQLVAETDEALTALVRRRLPLPPAAGRVRVRAADARAVLESARAGGYDLVVSDVYAGARTPPHMTTAECARAARRALRDGGVYAVNVADGPPLRHARSQAATVASAFAHVALIAEPGVLRGRRTGNLVLVASDSPLPAAELSRRTAGDPFPARVVTGTELARFASGAPVVTDAGTASPASPRPRASDPDR